MDARKKKILKAIVESYIRSAEPVGSKSLCGKDGLDMSPATLRHEMAALTEMGCLSSPHTSSGRVPTAAGYRLYVDELMPSRRLSAAERERISQMLRARAAELDRLIREAGRLLADLTHYAALTTTGRDGDAPLTRLELFLSEAHTLVMVAVFEGGLIENKLCRLPHPGKEEDVTALCRALSGVADPLALPEEEIHARAGDGFLYWPYVRAFLRSFRDEKIFVSGETHLLSHPEYQDVLRAKRVLEYITGQREALLRGIPKPPSRDGVRVIIGPENAAAELSDASVVMATYHLGGGLRGVIGVVGPTRMDYSRLTSRLSYFASRLGEI